MRKTIFALIGAVIIAFVPVISFANSLSVTSVLASASSTSVTFVVSVTATNSSADLVTNVAMYFGSYDGFQVAANWGKVTNAFGTSQGASSTTNYTNTVFGLTADKTFYYSVSADSASGTVWNAGISGQIVTPRGGFSGASNSAANALLPTGPNVTNVAWAVALTNLTTNGTFSASNIVSQVNTIILQLGTQLSNMTAQVSAINSNVHKSGTMP